MLLCLVKLLLRIGVERNLAYLRQVIRLGAVSGRVVRLQAAQRCRGGPSRPVSAAAVDSLAPLLRPAGARRVPDHRAPVVHLASQVLVGAI